MSILQTILINFAAKTDPCKCDEKFEPNNVILHTYIRLNIDKCWPYIIN